MMVRFSCFPTHIHYHRTKKDDQQCIQEYQEMHEHSPRESGDEALKVIPMSSASVLKMEEGAPSNKHANVEQITSPSSFEYCWKSEDLHDVSYPRDEIEIPWSMGFRKSQSLGSGLDREGGLACKIDTDDEIDQGSPSNNFQGEKFERSVNVHDNSCLQEIWSCNDVGMNLLNHGQEDAFGINADPASNGSTFFIGDMQQFDNEFCVDGEDRSLDHIIQSNHINSPDAFSKSHSLPSLQIYDSSPAFRLMPHRSRSVGNMCTVETKSRCLDGEGPEGLHSRMSFHKYAAVAPCPDMPQTSDTIVERVHSEADLGKECLISGADKDCKEVSEKAKDNVTQSKSHLFNNFSDNYRSDNPSILLNDRREPIIDDINHANVQLEETFGEWHDLNNKNFNINRIEEWIRQIDIHDSGIVQEVGESSSIPKSKKDNHLINGVSSTYPKGGAGVEAAYKYISSLAPASTSAQMTNLGLVVIPFLSAFSSLRVLNLSGNAIVKIASGALPRGLHMLNLSRNNISTIEGLRELTRLRVLDLSYNRIVRIGHGLAACSSLKELYLAGNKISEVEGLHRLLKLHVLDLQFNKISTAKCLGQLAANYASLQAINLEGNPAQRNVGEEQLKKYLLSLLPHLLYFNKHIIKASSTKELSERPSRSSTSHQFDRGTRSDHKRSRRGSHTAVSHRVTSSSNHFRVGQAVSSSSKPSKHRDRHTPLPLAGSKVYHPPRVESRLLSGLQPINPIRRIRSEGNL